MNHDFIYIKPPYLLVVFYSILQRLLLLKVIPSGIIKTMIFHNKYGFYFFMKMWRKSEDEQAETKT